MTCDLEIGRIYTTEEFGEELFKVEQINIQGKDKLILKCVSNNRITVEVDSVRITGEFDCLAG